MYFRRGGHRGGERLSDEEVVLKNSGSEKKMGEFDAAMRGTLINNI